MVWVAQETVSLDAVWIGAGAVIIAAVIAAWAADRRLQKTLRAERERSQDQLDAESQRLDRQLAHDRELTDLAELRTLLDSAMANVLSFYDAYTVVTQRHEQWLDDEDDLTTELEQLDEILEREDEGAREILEGEKERMEKVIEREKELLDFSKAAQVVMVDWLRVSARLPGEHAVVKAHGKVMDMAGSRTPEPDVPPSRKRLQEMEAAQVELWNAHGELIVACRTAIGSRLQT